MDIQKLLVEQRQRHIALINEALRTEGEIRVLEKLLKEQENGDLRDNTSDPEALGS